MPEEQRDRTTRDELEDLYRKVSQDDPSRDDANQAIDLTPCYTVLQVHPDATLIEIAEAYNQLKDTWREDRFANVEAWQEKSKAKLAEIKDAYEKILSYRQYESRNDLLHEPEMPDDETLLARPEEDLIAEAAPAASHIAAPRSRKPQGLLIAGIISAVILVLLGMFVWPTLYRYDVIKAGDKVYPLRINRVTSDIAYFNGKKWSPPPVPIDTPVKAPEQIRPPAPMAATVIPPARPAGEAATIAQKPAEKVVPAVVPKKKAVAEKPVKLSKSAPAAPSETPKHKAAAKPPERSAVKTGNEGTYSIQLKAFQDEGKARNYMQALKTDQGKLRIQKTVAKDRTVWYRILLGQFKTRDEAVAFIQKKKIQQTYPGSFIQNTGKGA